MPNVRRIADDAIKFFGVGIVKKIHSPRAALFCKSRINFNADNGIAAKFARIVFAKFAQERAVSGGRFQNAPAIFSQCNHPPHNFQRRKDLSEVRDVFHQHFLGYPGKCD